MSQDVCAVVDAIYDLFEHIEIILHGKTEDLPLDFVEDFFRLRELEKELGVMVGDMEEAHSIIALAYQCIFPQDKRD